jgi:KTSC domain
MIYVDSTSLDQIGFDDGNSEVHVVFKNGEHYVYSNVSQEVWEEFRNATSKGTFLNRELKAKGYPYRKM